MHRIPARARFVYLISNYDTRSRARARVRSKTRALFFIYYAADALICRLPWLIERHDFLLLSPLNYTRRVAFLFSRLPLPPNSHPRAREKPVVARRAIPRSDRSQLDECGGETVCEVSFRGDKLSIRTQSCTVECESRRVAVQPRSHRLDKICCFSLLSLVSLFLPASQSASQPTYLPTYSHSRARLDTVSSTLIRRNRSRRVVENRVTAGRSLAGASVTPNGVEYAAVGKYRGSEIGAGRVENGGWSDYNRSDSLSSAVGGSGGHTRRSILVN